MYDFTILLGVVVVFIVVECKFEGAMRLCDSLPATTQLCTDTGDMLRCSATVGNL